MVVKSERLIIVPAGGGGSAGGAGDGGGGAGAGWAGGGVGPDVAFEYSFTVDGSSTAAPTWRLADTATAPGQHTFTLPPGRWAVRVRSTVRDKASGPSPPYKFYIIGNVARPGPFVPHTGSKRVTTPA